MADDCYFQPEDEPAAESDEAAERLATPQQWAAMKFAPVRIDPGKFGTEWEQARGAIARTTIALLGLDDQELTRRFMNQPEPLRRVMDVHAGLQLELEHLKAHIETLEMASARLLCVASRCAEQPLQGG